MLLIFCLFVCFVYFRSPEVGRGGKLRGVPARDVTPDGVAPQCIGDCLGSIIGKVSVMPVIHNLFGVFVRGGLT